jgi:predicted DNA-binding transcriptional regulator YafY
MSLWFTSFEEARGRLLGYGRALEVVEPLALRLSVADYARQIVDVYAGG